MKRQILKFAVFAIVFVISIVSFPFNSLALTNGSFESGSGTGSGSTFSDWPQTQSSATAEPERLNWPNAHDGSFVASFNRGGKPTGGVLSQYTTSPVEAQEYTLSFYVYENGDNPPKSSLRARVANYREELVSEDVEATSKSWERHAFCFTPSTSGRLLVSFEDTSLESSNLSRTDLILDNVQISEGCQQ